MQAPDFSRQSVLEALRKHFGLEGRLSALLGERDQNLRLVTPDGRRLVVKISPLGESRFEADLQVRALLHLEKRRTAISLPRVVASLGGDHLVDIDGHTLRVVTWTDGEILKRDAMTPAITASLGHGLATLGRGLSTFDHAGKARQLDWDLQRALSLRERVPAIRDHILRADVEATLDEFETAGLPLFARLRRQVIHNDANPDNVLYDSKNQVVTGFIDFGDIVEAPLIADVAIAGAYLRDPEDPARLLAPFVAGYQAVTPLNDEELGLLHLLIRVRLATTVTMAHWRAAEFGNDDEYLRKALTTEGDVERFLRVLTDIAPGDFLRRLLSQ